MLSILVHSAAVFAAMLVALSTGSIYHCIEPGKPVEFTDVACRNGRLVELNEREITSLPGMSPELIDRLHNDTDHRIDEQQRRSRSLRTLRHQQREHTKASCAEASRALDALITHRRKGYSAADSAHLNAREEALKIALQEC
ncbi:MAG: hypothetical protein O3A63_00985 [Proteobacteria bacterium]|nr:hypothetical protein [Pseudomonadota bacterium]